MTNVVFDTNVILNAAMERPGSDEALKLIQTVISGEIIGVVTANTILVEISRNPIFLQAKQKQLPSILFRQLLLLCYKRCFLFEY